MTLQDQYTQIQEGKGDKNHFLKQARHLFPDYVNQYNSYNETVKILKDKKILTESKAGLGMVSTNGKRVEDWISIFQESVKAEEKKTSKEVLDNQAHNYDNKDPKNIDNLYGNTFLNGFYTEMQDPKNADKSVDELKQVVAKNLGKDWNYYAKNAQFGVKEIGYTNDAPGLGEPVAPKGKYKASGYGDLPKKKTVKEGLIKENKKEREFIKHLEDLAEKHGLVTPEEADDEDAKIHDKIINSLYSIYDRKFYDKETFTDADYKEALDMLAKKIKRPLSESLNEEFKVDPTYTHFALGKADNKIVTGWEYKDLDVDDIKYYTKMDLKDMDLKPSDYTILSVKALKQKGIDPFSWDSWRKQNESLTEAEDKKVLDMIKKIKLRTMDAIKQINNNKDLDNEKRIEAITKCREIEDNAIKQVKAIAHSK